MNSEMDAMKSNNVWELVDLPVEIKLIGCKWVHKRKGNAKGKINTFKVRLVAKRYPQKVGNDYDETFLLVAIFKYICILLSITTALDYEI